MYLLLGVENQSNVHYAMPVKNMVYDSLEYAAQVQKVEASHKKARKEKDPKRRNQVAEEFLRGFYRRQAASIITVVVYYSGADGYGMHPGPSAGDVKLYRTNAYCHWFLTIGLI
ncbi:MAG: hypothetical protein ACLUVM_04385 [Blautia faecis]